MLGIHPEKTLSSCIIQRDTQGTSLVIQWLRLHSQCRGPRFNFWSGSSVQSLCCVLLFMIPWMAVRQASLFITNSWNLLKFTSIESNHFILCHPLLLTPSIFPSNRVFSNESVLPIRWKVSGFQLQHHSFQRVFRTDFL